MSRSTTSPSRARPLVALLPLLSAAAPSQSEAPSPYARALQTANADAWQRLQRGASLWSDHSTWETAWVARSEHFSVRTTSSYGQALDLAGGLDVMLANFKKTLGTDRGPTGIQHVFVFPDLGAYNQYGNQHGEHHSSFYGSFFAGNAEQTPVASLWSDNATLLRMQLTHSAVHQFLAAAWPGSTRPAWLEEGLASYFAAWWNYDWTLTEYERLHAAGELPPLPRLLRDDIPAYTTDTHARMTELAMLFYWLFRFREDTRTQGDADTAPAPFRDYVTALLDGRPTTGLHCHALFADPDRLEKDLLAFTFPR